MNSVWRGSEVPRHLDAPDRAWFSHPPAYSHGAGSPASGMKQLRHSQGTATTVLWSQKQPKSRRTPSRQDLIQTTSRGQKQNLLRKRTLLSGKANQKMQSTVWFQIQDTLEKGKLQRQEKEQWLLGGWEERRMNRWCPRDARGKETIRCNTVMVNIYHKTFAEPTECTTQTVNPHGNCRFS